jgi:DNA-binding NtrC family response regulator
VSERTLSYATRREGVEDRFAAPCLALAFACEQPLAPTARYSLGEVDAVVIGRGERAARREADGGARLVLAVPDGWMSSAHARLERRGERWHLVDLGSKNGCFVAGLRVSDAALADGDLIEIGSTLFLFRAAVERRFGEPVDVVLDRAADEPAFATLSAGWARVLADLARLATSGVALVLEGESGTGKEVLARAIHRRSARPGPLIAVNCGALPDGLVEAELFGHKKGAFSGATAERPGLVRAAHGGTLFLDEIAELPLAAQVKLLRVLQEREVTPLGATTPVPVDLRVVSASHRALPVEVAAGRFRADLHARLAGHTVAVPPLRARREDLGVIVAAILRGHLGEDAARVRFDRDAARQLFVHPWPANVRELEQLLVAALALAVDHRIGLAQLAALGQARPTAARDGDDALRAELIARLTEHGGNLSAVARAMGKDRVQLRRWCRRFGLDPESFRAGG